ncbi:MAG: clostripain-related cysteine peptidase [Candidatus Sericytochromatia bacterium]|nr:clostripain-related cysteine peptidase [Candidatus Sericytochromatia bacterium]
MTRLAHPPGARRPWHSWLLPGLLAVNLGALGCGQAPLAGPGPRAGNVEARGASPGRPGLAVFYGMDDYSGADTSGELKGIHGMLASVGSSPRADLFLGGDASTREDGFRVRVTRGQPWGVGFQPLGELQTNHTPALRDYLAWTGQQRGGQPFHLAIATHGGQWGILVDHNGKPADPAASMTLQKASKALGKGYTGRRIPSLTFDACMMASIEVGEALKGTVACYTGSEDYAMTGSVPYDELASALLKEDGADGEAFARRVPDAVVHRGRWGDKGSLTWSAIALDQRHDHLVKQVNRLAKALRRALPRERAAIAAAVRATEPFALAAKFQAKYGDPHQRDLIQLCQALERRVQDEHVRESARAVTAATRATVIAFARHPSEAMANGLAIFLPQGPEAARLLPFYRTSPFARHTEWDEFLAALAG